MGNYTSYGPVSFNPDIRSEQLQAQTAPEKRAPQIQTQLEILAKEASAQRELIERFANRLEPALSLCPPTGASGAENRNEPTCPIAGAISQMVAQIAQNSAILHSLMSRLEV